MSVNFTNYCGVVAYRLNVGLAQLRDTLSIIRPRLFCKGLRPISQRMRAVLLAEGEFICRSCKLCFRVASVEARFAVMHTSNNNVV